MAEPTVDVLKQLRATRVELCAALKRDDITYEQIDSLPSVRRLDATIAAVAELVEADREYDLAAAALCACTNKPAHTLVALLDYADAARNRFEVAKARRATALTRVGVRREVRWIPQLRSLK